MTPAWTFPQLTASKLCILTTRSRSILHGCKYMDNIKAKQADSLRRSAKIGCRKAIK